MNQIVAGMMRMGEGLRLWLMAVRPRTLTIALAPVLVGTTLAWTEAGRVDVWLFAVIMLAAVLIQAGTNLHNDAADVEADSGERLGPPRVSALGLLSAEDVRRAAWVSFGLAALLGLWLVWKGGWPILVIGMASILAGAAYSSGPRPISHTPFGEVFVVAFFGLAAVAGTYYLQAGTVSPRALVAGLIVGFPAGAVLLVNNTRDVIQDMAAGRLTLAIRIGKARAAIVYAFLVLAPYVLLALPWPGYLSLSGRLLWPVFITLPYAVWLVMQFRKKPVGYFNLLLVNTAKLQFAIAALMCLSLVQ